MPDDLTIIIRAHDEASRVLDSVEHKLSNTQQAMVGVGAAMTAVGAAGIAGFGAAIQAAATFEATMSGVKAVIGGAEFGQFGGELEALAKKLGKDTVFSAAEAGKAIEELAKGGVKTADILGGSALAAVNLAAAGNIKLAEAAEIAANAANIFGISGEGMAHVADLIAGAANASSLEVNDFRLSLQQVGAVAKVSGQTFDSTAQAIAIMGQAGIKASDAGTSLKTFLINLQNDSKPAQAAMRELGIITADGANRFIDAGGKIKSMAEIAGVLKAATEGLTEAQKLQSLQTIFGTDALRAAAIIAESGAEGFNEMAAAMSKVTAADVAATKLDNLRGAIKQLEGSLETAAINIGQKLIPALRFVGEAVNTVVNAFLELPEPVQTTMVAVAAAVTAFAAIGGPLLVLAGLLPTIQAGFVLMAPAILAVAGPVAVVGAAVALLAAAWVNDWGNIRTETLRVLEHIQPVLDHLGELLGRIGGVVGLFVSDWLRGWGAVRTGTEGDVDAITSVADHLIRWFHDDLAPALDTFTTVWVTAWEDAESALIGAINVVEPLFLQLKDWVGAHLPQAVAQLQAIWAPFWAEVGPTVAAAAAVILPRLGDLAEWIGERLPRVFEAAGVVLHVFLDDLGALLGAVSRVLGPLADLIGGALQAANARIRGELEDSANAQAARRAGEAVGKGLTEGIAVGIASEDTKVIAAANEAVRVAELAAKQAAGISSPSQVFADQVGAPIAEGIAQGIQAGVGKVAAAVQGIVSAGLAAGEMEAGGAMGYSRTAFGAAPPSTVIGGGPNGPAGWGQRDYYQLGGNANYGQSSVAAEAQAAGVRLQRGRIPGDEMLITSTLSAIEQELQNLSGPSGSKIVAQWTRDTLQGVLGGSRQVADFNGDPYTLRSGRAGMLDDITRGGGSYDPTGVGDLVAQLEAEQRRRQLAGISQGARNASGASGGSMFVPVGGTWGGAFSAAHPMGTGYEQFAANAAGGQVVGGGTGPHEVVVSQDVAIGTGLAQMQKEFTSAADSHFAEEAHAMLARDVAEFQSDMQIRVQMAKELQTISQSTLDAYNSYSGALQTAAGQAKVLGANLMEVSNIQGSLNGAYMITGAGQMGGRASGPAASMGNASLGTPSGIQYMALENAFFDRQQDMIAATVALAGDFGGAAHDAYMATLGVVRARFNQWMRSAGDPAFDQTGPLAALAPPPPPAPAPIQYTNQYGQVRNFYGDSGDTEYFNSSTDLATGGYRDNSAPQTTVNINIPVQSLTGTLDPVQARNLAEQTASAMADELRRRGVLAGGG